MIVFDDLPAGECREISVYVVHHTTYPYIVIPAFTSPFFLDPVEGL